MKVSLAELKIGFQTQVTDDMSESFYANASVDIYRKN